MENLPCELVLKENFTKNGEPTFFIIKRYSEFDGSFKKQTLRGKVNI